MSALTEVPVVVPTVNHRPWWRGRPVKVVAVVAVMVVVYQALKLEYPWPTSLTFTSLSAHLDEFQTWLIDQRTAEDTGLFFTIFNWFRIFLDNLVGWLNQFILWMTWVGTTVAGTLARLALRRPARRGDHARRLRLVRAARPLAGEHGDARADDRLRRARAR